MLLYQAILLHFASIWTDWLQPGHDDHFPCPQTNGLCSASTHLFGAIHSDTYLLVGLLQKVLPANLAGRFEDARRSLNNSQKFFIFLFRSVYAGLLNTSRCPYVAVDVCEAEVVGQSANGLFEAGGKWYGLHNDTPLLPLSSDLGGGAASLAANKWLVAVGKGRRGGRCPLLADFFAAGRVDCCWYSLLLQLPPLQHSQIGGKHRELGCVQAVPLAQACDMHAFNKS
uniref:Uncharacterized protein n=1 Tax=Ditylenchus dipsaci TaxID=166011 RepID=A0A915DP72_9BILA